MEWSRCPELQPPNPRRVRGLQGRDRKGGRVSAPGYPSDGSASEGKPAWRVSLEGVQGEPSPALGEPRTHALAQVGTGY